MPEPGRPRSLRLSIVNGRGAIPLQDKCRPDAARTGRGGAGAASVAERPAMNKPPHSPKAGGMPIALGVMAGAIGGAVFGEATAGLLIGLTIGIVIAVVIWRRDRP